MQPLVKVTDCVKAPSVPQVKPVVGVQAWVLAGAAPTQLLLATGVPSLRVQVTVCVADPESAVAAQLPLRLWLVTPQPVAGAQLV